MNEDMSEDSDDSNGCDLRPDIKEEPNDNSVEPMNAMKSLINTKLQSLLKKSVISSTSQSSPQELVCKDMSGKQLIPRSGRKVIQNTISKDPMDVMKAKQQLKRSSQELVCEDIIEDSSEDSMESFNSNDDRHNKKSRRVVVNVEHPSGEPDVYLSAKISKAVNAHQIGGIRFIYDNVVETIAHFKKTPNSDGFGCILSHAMGLGKTLQVIGFCEALFEHKILKKDNRVLIIAPVGTLANWSAEFKKWSPLKHRPYTLFVVHSSESYLRRAREVEEWRDKGGVLLIGYKMFRGLTKDNDFKTKQFAGQKPEVLSRTLSQLRAALLSPGPDVVVCDEGHRIKNYKTQSAKSLNEIQTRRRVVLTGTPLQNNLMEYWSMVDFARPHYLGLQKHFKLIVDRPIRDGLYADSTADQIQLMRELTYVLHEKTKGFVQRRSHDVFERVLPSKLEFRIHIRFTDIQKRLMKALIGTAIDKPEEIGCMDGKMVSILTLFAICSKIWNHPDVIHDVVVNNSKDRARVQDLDAPDNDDDGDEAPAEEPVQRKANYGFAEEILNGYQRGVITNSYKMVLLLEIISKSLMKGDKVLVFTQWLSTLDTIEDFIDGKKLAKSNDKWRKRVTYYRLDGSTPVKQRETDIERFNTNKKAKLYLISTRAGGLGINLTGANRIVVMDAAWNPCHDSQAACRVYRYGQRKKSYIYRFICDNSLEKKVSNKQVCKQGMARRVVDGKTVRSVISLKDSQSQIKELRTIEEPAVQSYPKNVLSPLKDNHLELICGKFNHAITTLPEPYDSLLEERVDQILTANEKESAVRGYETREKTISH
ncbi:unnamed protein product [Medioppia subpectinata]|uniref:Uncharacterized protein n=1 Tax=Medioppia subpectinata TaxID=1979941 RepID=A0A7R9Q320_9ACAR|nr:unnamed protein product [Medioppia subpectinata]CAG2110811.1 unnamed protein product [Medioppia subpectinata]